MSSPWVPPRTRAWGRPWPRPAVWLAALASLGCGCLSLVLVAGDPAGHGPLGKYQIEREKHEKGQKPRVGGAELIALAGLLLGCLALALVARGMGNGPGAETEPGSRQGFTGRRRGSRTRLRRWRRLESRGVSKTAIRSQVVVASPPEPAWPGFN